MKNAVIYMIISALAFALLNVFVKSLNAFNVYQIVFFRSIGTLFFTIPFIINSKLSIFGNKKTLLISRSIVGFTAMTLFFISLKHLSMGSAVSIRYIAPIFGAFFAVVLLKEKIKPVQWLYFGIAFIGVVILKGFDSNVNTTGLLYVTLSAIFTGLVYIIIRKIGDKDHPLIVVNYFMIISAVLGAILMINNWKSPKGLEWLILLSLGVFGYFGQYYMTKALQSTEINKVAPLKYIEVVFTVIIGFIWLNEIYALASIIGILLIVAALTLNTFSKK